MPQPCPVSQRGWFDYHYISQEPVVSPGRSDTAQGYSIGTKKSVSVMVYDQTKLREVWGQNDDGDRVPMEPVPDWKAVSARVPVMQYVICTGDGEIVDRIPVRGSRRKQVQQALTRLMVHMMAKP